MIKKVIVLLILAASFTFISADIYISGFNQAEFIHRSAKDSLKNYFEDELGVVVDYNRLSFGITFNAYLPKYDDESPLQELRSRDISYQWEERYLTYSGDNIGLKVGTLSESFGTGMTFRAYEDEDLNHDNRLEGAMTSFNYGTFKSKAIYGVSPVPDVEDKDDSFAGLEFSLSNDFMTFGGSALQIRERITDTNYSDRQVFSGNMNLYLDFMDIYGEYAYSELETNEMTYGHGIYANSNFYYGDLTFSAFYKKFENFNYDLNDLPTLNHADDVLDDYIEVGLDEEGAMGELTWDNSFAKLFASYAEAWSSDYNYRLSNGYLESSKYFGNKLLTLSYEHFERKNKDGQSWSKDLTPTAAIDIPFENNFSLYLKGHYTLMNEVHLGEEKDYVEPLLQTDFMYGDYALSIVSEAQMEDLSSVSDADFWLGATLSARVVDNTSVNIFVGKQKGGKLCQNGTCKYVMPFEGLKFEITTKF